MLVPLMPLVSASASANASTLIKIIDTTANLVVNQNASLNAPGAANPVTYLVKIHL